MIRRIVYLVHGIIDGTKCIKNCLVSNNQSPLSLCNDVPITLLYLDVHLRVKDTQSLFWIEGFLNG